MAGGESSVRRPVVRGQNPDLGQQRPRSDLVALRHQSCVQLTSVCPTLRQTDACSGVLANSVISNLVLYNSTVQRLQPVQHA